MGCCAFWDFAGKILEDVISGIILLFLGFFMFKQQESFKASSNEVRELCKKIQEALKPFADLNLQFEKFDLNTRLNYQVKLSDFPRKFCGRSAIENQVAINILRVTAPTGFEISIPEELNRNVILQRPLGYLRHFAIRLGTAHKVLLETLDRFNSRQPGVQEDNVSNIWNEYLRTRLLFSNHLKSLESISHNAVHGSYDWVKFSKELEKLEMSD